MVPLKPKNAINIKTIALHIEGKSLFLHLRYAY